MALVTMIINLKYFLGQTAQLIRFSAAGFRLSLYVAREKQKNRRF